MVRTMRVSCPMRPAIEAMLMTRPQRAGIIDLRPMCCVSTNTPVRLRFTSLSQASSGCSSAGAPQVAPALFTRMSMRLNLASTASAIGAIASRLPMSQTHASHSMLRVRRCATASSSSFCLRALIAIVAPISPSASASCSPSPREPPVTSACRPFRSSSFLTVATLAELMPWAMLIEFLPLMTTLVMFSGGLDSTAMLVQLLAHSREQLRVHHIRMANREQRAEAEQSAVERIVAWCASRYRPFRYSQSALDFRELEAIPIDYLCIAFVACQVAIDTPGCNRIAVAALARDTDIENRSARQRRVFETLYECYRARRLGEPRVEWIYPVYQSTKPELAGSLPPELVALTWSCRQPVPEAGNWRPCGACKACLARAGI